MKRKSENQINIQRRKEWEQNRKKKESMATEHQQEIVCCVCNRIRNKLFPIRRKQQKSLERVIKLNVIITAQFSYLSSSKTTMTTTDADWANSEAEKITNIHAHKRKKCRNKQRKSREKVKRLSPTRARETQSEIRTNLFSELNYKHYGIHFNHSGQWFDRFDDERKEKKSKGKCMWQNVFYFDWLQVMLSRSTTMAHAMEEHSLSLSRCECQCRARRFIEIIRSIRYSIWP